MAPISPKSKMRAYRARMSDDKKKEAKEKNKEQAKKYRNGFSEERIKEERLKNTIRKRNARRKKKTVITHVNLENGNITPSPFVSPQSEGKAVRKVTNILPNSPRKKVAVLTKSAIQHGIIQPQKRLKRTLFTVESNQLVEKFYNSDTISRQCPGLKDYVTIQKEGAKVRVQKRILTMNILEAFQQFKEEHPGIQIGKSKFASLRPAHVFPVSGKDHNQCCCIYHENFELLIEGLRKQYGHVKCAKELIALSVCNNNDQKCATGLCEQCNNDNINLVVQNNVSTFITSSTCNFYQWEKATSNKGLVQLSKDATHKEVVSQLKYMIKHCFIAKQQLHQIKKLKASVSSDSIAILQEDFAENFSLKHQNEIMNAHWNKNKNGVTIFTAIIYFNTDKYASFAIVSDYQEHNKFAVATFNRAILREVANLGKNINQLHVFSDGCGGQFKNCWNLSLITHPKILHPNLEKMDWSFFATSHGKGPIDGIGGTVKRAIWRRILREKIVVTSAEEFAHHAKASCPAINVLYIPTKEIVEVQTELTTFWDENKPTTIPETRANHYFCCNSPTSISYSIISPLADIVPDKKVHKIFSSPPTNIPHSSDYDSSNKRVLNTDLETPSTSTQHVEKNTNNQAKEDTPAEIGKMAELSIEVDRYYAVDYIDRYYIGRVLSQSTFDERYYSMKFLHKTSVDGISYFQWPERDDIDSVHKSIIFYGPISLDGCLLFTCPDLDKINEAFALRQ